MACDTKCCFIGNGLVFIRKLDSYCPTDVTPPTNALIEVGNVTELNLTFETTEESVPNLTDGSFGNYCSLERIDQVNLDMNMTCFKTKNLELALAGSTTEVIAGTATDEEHYVSAECSMVVLAHLPDRTQPIVVTGPAGVPVYTVGTDYIIRGDGIYIPAGTTITLPSVIEVTYDYLAQQEIDIAQVANAEYEVHVSGVNANDGSTFSETFYRVKFGPSDATALISTTFGSLNVSGEVLKDPCNLDVNGNAKRATFKMFP